MKAMRRVVLRLSAEWRPALASLVAGGVAFFVGNCIENHASKFKFNTIRTRNKG